MYIEIDVHFLRDKIADGAIEVTYAAFDDQLANLFTKSMTAFKTFISLVFTRVEFERGYKR